MENLTEEQKKIIALSNHLGESWDDAESKIDSEDYLVLTDDEATEKAEEQIEESLWAFKAEFLASHLNCPVESVQAIHDNEKCEDNNETFKDWLGDKLEDFKDDAISADGRGHFISGYDGEENEESVDSETFYIYRIN